VEQFFTAPLVPALVALIPAGVIWWRGRGVSRLIDDPALPERLMAGRTVHGAAVGCSFALLVLIWPRTTAWTLPLLFVGRMIAAYPARRVVFQETWSLGGYSLFFVRLIVAVFGFWILLALAPVLIHAAGPYQWAAAGALAVLLVAWSVRYADAVCALLGTRPIDDPALAARFARLVAASGIQAPRFARVEMRGGVFANAMALPSLRRSAVVFTDTVLSRLDADEVIAIAAHEVGHLEHYNRRRLQRGSLIGYALIGTATLVPAFERLLPGLATIIGYAWPALLFVALIARAQHRQRHETESDLRAVALTGDPDALVRALTKIHAIARMPRRWDAQFERRATHPSLARRIKAIREAGGNALPPVVLGEAAAFDAPDGSASVIFHDDRLEWRERNIAEHVLRYAHVTELRLDARRTGTPHLVAVDGTGRRWQLQLRDGDVGRAQEVLDVVDVRVATPAPPAVSPALTRWLALSLVAIAATATQFAAMTVALLAVVRPGRRLSAAAGIAALSAAAVGLRVGPVRAGGSTIAASAALVIALLGAALLWIARVNGDEEAAADSWRFDAVLGILAALAWTVVLSNGVGVVRIHQTARAWPAAAVFSLAFGAAAASTGSRRARAGAAVAALAGLLAIAAGSDQFLTWFSGDPFVATTESLRVRTISPASLGEFAVPVDADQIRLSPNGRSFAVSTENDDEETTFHVGRAGGPLTPFDADDAVFIGDDEVLLLQHHGGGGASVRQATVGRASTVVRERDFPGMLGAALSFNPARGTWALVGHSRDGHLLRVTGNRTSDAVQEQRWTLPQAIGTRASAVWSSDADALVMETRFVQGPLGSSGLRQWAALFGRGWWTESQLWRIAGEGNAARASTQLDLQCAAGQAQVPAVCGASDGVRTRLFVVDPRVDPPRPIGSLPGRVYVSAANGPDCVEGWWNNDAVVLRLSTREALRFARHGREHVRAITVADGMLAALVSTGDDRSIVRLYARP
jgi:Zn-dependent protease with chaperone function